MPNIIFLPATVVAAGLAMAQPFAATAADTGFCGRLKIQTEAARSGFKSIRGEFRAGRTGSGLLIMRTYSNVELWPDTACYFSVDADAIVHSCETGFDKDDATARLTRDAMLAELKTCFGKDVAGAPALSDTDVHGASLSLSGKRAVLLSVNAQEKDGTDGRILISVRALQ